MTFAPTTKVGYEGGLAHDRAILQEMQRKYAADGGGFVAKPSIPNVMDGDVVVINGKEKKKENKLVSTTVLLAGGALVGYLCRGQISKGVDALKNTVGKFFSNGKPAELLEKGKGLLDKAKGFIFSQK